MERRIVEDGEDMSFDFVKTVIADIGLNAEAELYSCEDGTRRIAIVGDDASALIGHHGDTLDALQYLANLASARKNSKGERDKSRVTIDIEGYRKKREDTLRALARRMAAKALRNKRSVMLEPMSAYERRIIHSEIQGIEGVSTNSIGSDNNRKIVIFLTDKKPKELFDEQTPDIEVEETTEA
jgi:spoIIIJ-associated protein